ncbi:CDP-diacylglycerol--glycerol-3-phosphate 3-phosphatidyltransferase [Magnetospirillum sp. SS-4]|uniref:CDP-diacylglycerol--glycerol-3-phosphate 3-phosphatidyltransferase n=1 Tax=Magnetospirillum sp. SS-4 TaxID=2681465 RepID=UPI0013811695|nr:CDP-diacylglycerol--glycerol-3-phosphate 3-phosphatidyltransferase [Magnetospirillum sp. SS-4]CAA7618191.1 CDP-diacylglycerol--glycerol-3-phosphate 3-phosphatidyltransferase [Magnetospirillum sp. SS-4]
MVTSLPNLLTLSRIVVIPLVVGLFYIDGEWPRWAACALFVAAAITDWFDGYVARSLNLVSTFGRFLDPIADKLLVVAVLFMLVAFDRVSPVSFLPALVIVLREILVSGLREFLAEVRVGMPVSRLAKWKTGIQMVAIPVLLVGDAATFMPTRQIGEVGLWLAALLTLVTGWDYLQSGMCHIRAHPTPPQE